MGVPVFVSVGLLVFVHERGPIWRRLAAVLRTIFVQPDPQTVATRSHLPDRPGRRAEK
jgi:hypothetical protein